MNNGSKNVFAQALIFRQQIGEKKRSSNGNWYWECYLSGPISDEDTETIMRVAGCWCEDNIKKIQETSDCVLAQI